MHMAFPLRAAPWSGCISAGSFLRGGERPSPSSLRVWAHGPPLSTGLPPPATPSSPPQVPRRLISRQARGRSTSEASLRGQGDSHRLPRRGSLLQEVRDEASSGAPHPPRPLLPSQSPGIREGRGQARGHRAGRWMGRPWNPRPPSPGRPQPAKGSSVTLWSCGAWLRGWKGTS